MLILAFATLGKDTIIDRNFFGMQQIINNILPLNFSVQKLNRSKKKLSQLYVVIKKSTTLDNYKNLYHHCLEIIHNYNFKYLFAKTYRDFICSKFKEADIRFIDLDLVWLKKKRIFKPIKKSSKKFSKNYNQKHDNSVSRIYNTPASNSKPIYNLPRY